MFCLITFGQSWVPFNLTLEREVYRLCSLNLDKHFCLHTFFTPDWAALFTIVCLANTHRCRRLLQLSGFGWPHLTFVGLFVLFRFHLWLLFLSYKFLWWFFLFHFFLNLNIKDTQLSSWSKKSFWIVCAFLKPLKHFVNFGGLYHLLCTFYASFSRQVYGDWMMTWSRNNKPVCFGHFQGLKCSSKSTLEY